MYKLIYLCILLGGCTSRNKVEDKLINSLEESSNCFVVHTEHHYAPSEVREKTPPVVEKKSISSLKRRKSKRKDDGFPWPIRGEVTNAENGVQITASGSIIAPCDCSIEYSEAKTGEVPNEMYLSPKDQRLKGLKIHMAGMSQVTNLTEVKKGDKIGDASGKVTLKLTGSGNIPSVQSLFK